MGRTNLLRMNLHIGDYLRHTRHLRANEHGAYLMLIMHYTSNAGLPDDDHQLAAIAGMSAAEWRKHKPAIAPFFEPGWRLPWLEADIADSLASRKRRSDAGKWGNVVKKQSRDRHRNADRQAFGPGPQCDRNAIASNPLPLAARHIEEPDQENNSFIDDGNDLDPLAVVPFLPRRK
jgi:uncharacterized protein YdaU (DUF1376 family)